MRRRVEPEILDHLPADDPRARRSRRDLRRVNFLMGNDRWILRQVRRFREVAERGGIAEWGAGDGALAARLATEHPEAVVECFDLSDRPAGLGSGIRWRREDVLEAAPAVSGVLVANLFLHHFEAPDLARMGGRCADFGVLVFSEPLRTRLAAAQGGLLLPFVGSVTRHDMPVSIRAGFRPGELPELLGLSRERWEIREQCNWRGACRVLAWRA